MSDSATHGVSVSISGLAPGETPYMLVSVPLCEGEGRDSLAERILAAVFGTEDELHAAVERFRNYEAAR